MARASPAPTPAAALKVESVLAEATSHDDVSARVGDVPELAEAGWSMISMKGLEVCVRVVG